MVASVTFDGRYQGGKKNMKLGVGVSALNKRVGADTSVGFSTKNKLIQATADVGAKGLLSVGSHARLGTNNSVGLNLNIGRADFGSKASIGTHGVEAKLFGFGLALGKSKAMLTPFGNLKIR